jgi:hypothetical protein
LPLFLFGILEYSSSPGLGAGILGIGIFMLALGVSFIVILLTQKST